MTTPFAAADAGALRQLRDLYGTSHSYLFQNLHASLMVDDQASSEHEHREQLPSAAPAAGQFERKPLHSTYPSPVLLWPPTFRQSEFWFRDFREADHHHLPGVRAVLPQAPADPFQSHTPCRVVIHHFQDHSFHLGSNPSPSVTDCTLGPSPDLVYRDIPYGAAPASLSPSSSVSPITASSSRSTVSSSVCPSPPAAQDIHPRRGGRSTTRREWCEYCEKMVVKLGRHRMTMKCPGRLAVEGPRGSVCRTCGHDFRGRRDNLRRHEELFGHGT